MDKIVEAQLEKICRIFQIQGEMRACGLISSGNINHTYHVTFQDAQHEKEYIIQRINTYVFKDPCSIMHNIDLITKHIRKKLDCPSEETDRYVLHLLQTSSGENYYISENGDVWRMYPFITDSVAYDNCNDPQILRAAGTAFGLFQTQLADFDASTLHETIPNFHNTALRLKTFFEHIKEDPCGRVQELDEEIAYIRSMQEIASRLTNMLNSNEIPLRVTHNDTKTNNVLIDSRTNQPLAVIDLDTVMPGLAMHDFGDAIRFAANVAAEDEPDTTKVRMDLELFRAFAEGFIEQTARSLTEKEIETMALGAVTITVELAVRFLDDYITGDKYFKVNYPGHNLVRARCQLTLAKDMIRKLDEMNQIVEKIAQEARKNGH